VVKWLLNLEDSAEFLPEMVPFWRWQLWHPEVSGLFCSVRRLSSISWFNSCVSYLVLLEINVANDVKKTL
jgi:hypothetical protein